MFSFHGPLPIAAAQLLSFTLVTASGAVTFDSISIAGTATASGGRRLFIRGLLTRNLVPSYYMRPRR